MGRKRQEMAVGTLDNITEQCPRSTYRFAPWAVEEIEAWLMLRIHQHVQCRDKLQEIMLIKPDPAIQGQLHYRNDAIAAVEDLLMMVRCKWSAAEWWDAVQIIEDAKRKAAAVQPADDRPNPFD
jgi:hypothetical protein